LASSSAGRGSDTAARIEEAYLPERTRIGSLKIVGVEGINAIVVGDHQDDVAHAAGGPAGHGYGRHIQRLCAGSAKMHNHAKQSVVLLTRDIQRLVQSSLIHRD